MKTEEFRIDAFDNTQLYVRCWCPDNFGKGIIILIHGLGEHINRYNQWAERFVNSGWTIVGFDLRGHGFSGGKRGTGSYEALMKDVDSVFNFVRNKFGKTEQVLYGHSMGGNLALGYMLTRKPDVRRLIITSPWLKLSAPPARAIVLLVKILSRFIPFVTISNKLASRYISRDEAVCRDYENDPLVHDKISLKLFLDVHRWGKIILNCKHKINVPLLLLHGSDDRITSWKGSYLFAIETSDITVFKLWNQCYHELHNELCKDEVFEYVDSWLSNVQKKTLQENVS